MFSALQPAAGLFLLLMLYSFLGWCGEMIYCSLGQRRLCEKRGVLNGPSFPISGHGALLVLWALDGGAGGPILTFFGGMLLTTAVEYATSCLMEKLFHMRWWDYSAHRFQLNGRVCLLNSTLFGLACVALCHFIHPRVMGPLRALFAHGAGVPLALALFAVYLADIAVSVRSAIRMGSRLEKLRAVQEELQQKLEALKEEQARAIEERRQKWESAAEARMAQWEERRQASEQRLRQGLESLGDRGEAYAQHLSRLKAEAQQRMRRLLEDQDFLERRLFRAHPTLRSERYGEAVDRLRDYLDKRKKR